MTLYDGRTVIAYTLYSDTQVTGGMPSRRYLNMIIDGAKQNGLDGEYIKALEGLPSHDRTRRVRLVARLPFIVIFKLT